MGFFDRFKGINIQTSSNLLDRRSIPSEQIDNMQQINASNSYCKRIWKMFYKDYPEKPFVSKDREINTNWIEQAEMFPNQSLVS